MSSLSYRLRSWWIAVRFAALDPAPWLLGSSLILIVWGVAVLVMGETAKMSMYDTLDTLPLVVQGAGAVGLGAFGLIATSLAPRRTFVLAAWLIMLVWLWIGTAFAVELGVSTAFVYFGLAGFDLWAIYRARIMRQAICAKPSARHA